MSTELESYAVNTALVYTSTSDFAVSQTVYINLYCRLNAMVARSSYFEV